jgi:hypothetical protein
VDPSLVIGEAWLSWIEEEADESAASEIVISANFVESLERRPDPVFFPFLAEEHQADYNAYRERAGAAVRDRGLRQFSFEEHLSQLTGPQQAVINSLLATNELDGRILADEWTYLVTQSKMLARTQAAIRALKRRGAVVVEVADHWTRRMAADVMPKERIPQRFTTKFLARVGAKWVALGAADAAAAVGGGLLGGSVLGPLGAIGGGAVAVRIIGGGASNLLVVIDP